MTGLLELADGCEKATGPDRELDCAIYNAIPDGPNHKAERLPMEKWGDRFDDGWHTMWADREDKYPEQLKRYTASLDAAMTLVPEGFRRSIEDMDEGTPPLCRLELHNGDDEFWSRALTWPLAICAAALKARARHTPESKQ